MGLSREEYLESTDYELEALCKTWTEIQTAWTRRFANFMALFANANAAKGKQFESDDFMPVTRREPMPAEDVFAKFDAAFRHVPKVREGE